MVARVCVGPPLRALVQNAPDDVFPLVLVGVDASPAPIALVAVSLDELKRSNVNTSAFVAAVFAPFVALGPPDAELLLAEWRILTEVADRCTFEELSQTSLSNDEQNGGAVRTASNLMRVTASFIDSADALCDNGVARRKHVWACNSGCEGCLPEAWLAVTAPLGNSSTAAGATSVDAGLLTTCLPAVFASTFLDDNERARTCCEQSLAAQAALEWRETVAIHLTALLPAVVVTVPATDAAKRRSVHRALLLPNRPLLFDYCSIFPMGGTSSTLNETGASNGEEEMTQTRPNIRTIIRAHEHLPQQPLRFAKNIPNATTHITRDPFDYYHYGIDGFDDTGWGCAYRSLQTVLSWFQRNGFLPSSTFRMPSLTDIQRILSVVDSGKRNMSKFVGSKTWIGSVEVMLVLQHYLPRLECQIQRLEQGAQLAEDVGLHRRLVSHFDRGGPPVMLGGAAYAHTIAGINCNVRTGEAQYLIYDPHYASQHTDVKVVQQKGWVGWKDPRSFFDQKQWYNICIPMVHAVDWT